MITGLSLSFCISSICRGEIKEEEVEKIIAGIQAPTGEIFQEVLYEYAKTYWQNFPKKAIEVANRLYDQGRIEQPRLDSRPIFFIGDGPWMDKDQKTFRVGKDGVRVYSGHKAQTW